MLDQIERLSRRRPDQAAGPRTFVIDPPRADQHYGFELAADLTRLSSNLKRSAVARDREEQERTQEQAEKERLLQEKADLAEQQARQEREARRRARRWTIGMAVLALLTLTAAFLAVDQWREATAKTHEAARLLLTANVNVAQAHEEKALALLKEAEDTGRVRDYRRVWMQILQAQRQPIPTAGRSCAPSTSGPCSIRPHAARTSLIGFCAGWTSRTFRRIRGFFNHEEHCSICIPTGPARKRKFSPPRPCPYFVFFVHFVVKKNGHVGGSMMTGVFTAEVSAPRPRR